MRRKFLIPMIAMLALGFLQWASAINTPQEGYQITATSSDYVRWNRIDVYNDCNLYRVFNGFVFVPTRTQAEYISFRNQFVAGPNIVGNCTRVPSNTAYYCFSSPQQNTFYVGYNLRCRTTPFYRTIIGRTCGYSDYRGFCRVWNPTRGRAVQGGYAYYPPNALLGCASPKPSMYSSFKINGFPAVQSTSCAP